MNEQKRTPSRQARRTQKLLQEALLALIAQRPYDLLTVQDIVEQADMGRATFYRHYKSKDDLLVSIVDTHYHTAKAFKEAFPFNPYQITELRQLFEDVQQHASFYQLVFDHPLTANQLREYMLTEVRENLPHFLPPDPFIPMEAACNFVIGALLGLLRWRLEEGATYTADEVIEMFLSMMAQGVPRAMMSK